MFNAKRDLHWLRRYGIKFQHKRVWDVQLCHFILLGQEIPYPSLDDVCIHYGVDKKLDVIQQYIEKKVDIDEIPLKELIPYLEQDLRSTGDCYSHQLQDSRLSADVKRLTILCNIDLLILEEIEWNGLIYDIEKSCEKADEIRTMLRAIDSELSALSGGSSINWNSGDHLSAILYGGTIEEVKRVEDGLYKTGKKAGQTRFRLERSSRIYPRIVTPLDDSELNKGGVWSTAEPVLKQLKARGKAAQIIGRLLERAKLEKLVSSYFEGIPKQLRTMRWGTTIHGTLNQCVAATGRLSSSKPNLQNNPKEVDKLFVSRYA